MTLTPQERQLLDMMVAAKDVESLCGYAEHFRLEQQRLDDAELFAGAAVRVAPADAEARSLRANFLMFRAQERRAAGDAQGEDRLHRRAFQEYETCIELEPSSPMAYLGMARIQNLHGPFEDALHNLNLYERLGGRNRGLVAELRASISGKASRRHPPKSVKRRRRQMASEYQRSSGCGGCRQLGSKGCPEGNELQAPLNCWQLEQLKRYPSVRSWCTVFDEPVPSSDDRGRDCDSWSDDRRR